MGWQRILYVPDLNRTDPDGQTGRSLLLYRQGQVTGRLSPGLPDRPRGVARWRRQWV